jgi:REase_DpnII-MboI
VSVSSEARLAALLPHIPALEERARALQVGASTRADQGAIERLRDDYLQWYAQCLIVVPQALQARFRDFYEGGAFTKRIRQFLEAPTQRNPLVTDDRSAAPNPLIPYWSNPVETTFVPSLLGQRQVLEEALESERSGLGQTAAHAVEAACRRLPLAIRSMQRRHADRPPFAITDEYDVQDLVRTILIAMFEDVRPEEWTPSYAGGSSRMDFLLKREQVVIETKMTRSGHGARAVRDELAVDLLRYQAHRDCKILVCVVYDPDGFIDNPRGFEQDMTGAQGNITLRVAVVQGA